MQPGFRLASCSLVLVLACSRTNPDFDADTAGEAASETLASGSSAESSSNSASAGDGDGDGMGGFCGDGNTDLGEQCDDGNAIDNDGCSASCMLENPDPLDCVLVPQPANCFDCVNVHCCSNEALMCLDSMGCMCVVGCAINNGGALDGCAMQCGVDPAQLMPFVDAVMCMAMSCGQFCP